MADTLQVEQNLGTVRRHCVGHSMHLSQHLQLQGVCLSPPPPHTHTHTQLQDCDFPFPLACCTAECSLSVFLHSQTPLPPLTIDIAMSSSKVQFFTVPSSSVVLLPLRAGLSGWLVALRNLCNQSVSE